ncbi:hypothetical protein [Lichenicoccus sp.]|uniref:hypothetical protein n=1 Tax=Lichenicoccus sp. TaxID=2781899 RepID=UPI003D10B64C
MRPIAGIVAIVAIVSSVAALALLLLPLVLVLLMVLFDTTAHGVLVLLGLLLGWLRAFLPGSPHATTGAGFHPLGVALGSLLHAIPVLGGLLAILSGRQPRHWRGALLLWVVAAAFDGSVVAATLAPAIAGAAIGALPARRDGNVASPQRSPSGSRPAAAAGRGGKSQAQGGASDQPESTPDRPGGHADQEQRSPQG